MLCHYAECHDAECGIFYNYAECRGALTLISLSFLCLSTKSSLKKFVVLLLKETSIDKMIARSS
jgi:hypothetical protein